MWIFTSMRTADKVVSISMLLLECDHVEELCFGGYNGRRSLVSGRRNESLLSGV